MNKPSEGQKKIAALNLKSMLGIFTIELDNIINAGAQPQPQPSPQMNNMEIDQFPIVEPPLPAPMLPLQHKSNSGFDMSQLD